VEPLRRWPPASALPQLIRRSAGFVAEGCQASSLRIGGRAYVRVLVPAAGPASAGCHPRPAAPPLATLVLRAPSAGLATQYEAVVLRAMRSLRTWADAGEVTAEQRGDAGEVTAEQTPAGELTAVQTNALLSLPGGGAAEMQLAALCRAAATDADAAASDGAGGNRATGERVTAGVITSERGIAGVITSERGMAGVITSERGIAVALRALAAALHALPRQVR